MAWPAGSRPTGRVGQAPELIEALCGTTSVDALLGAFALPAGRAGRGAAQRHRPSVQGDRVEDILTALDHAAEPMEPAWRPPPRLDPQQISDESQDRARADAARPALDFDECMRTEYRIVSRVVRDTIFTKGSGRDRRQGSGAALAAGTLEAVSAADVERHFASIADELALQ